MSLSARSPPLLSQHPSTIRRPSVITSRWPPVNLSRSVHIFLLVNDRHARSGRAVVISFTQYPKKDDSASAPHAESHYTTPRKATTIETRYLVYPIELIAERRCICLPSSIAEGVISAYSGRLNMLNLGASSSFFYIYAFEFGSNLFYIREGGNSHSPGAGVHRPAVPVVNV